jgi:putative membrane protein
MTAEFLDPSTELASSRTEMSLERTALSSDRTLMSVVRTSLSLIGFGFTIFQFFHKLNQDFVAGELGAAPRRFGASLIILGIVTLTLGIINHLNETKARRQRRNMLLNKGLIRAGASTKPSSSMVVAILLLVIGIVAIVRIVFRAGPF